MTERDSLVNVHRAHQEKYIYYLIALCVASVGFSVSITIQHKLSWIDLPLGISILCLVVSIYCGLKFLQWVGSSIYANISLMDVISGNYKDTGTHPQKIEIAVNTITKILEDNSRKTHTFGSLQNYAFYAGVFFFIIWRILQMLPNEVSTRIISYFL